MERCEVLAVFAIRPDRHVGFRGSGADIEGLERHAALVTGGA